jgi:hypothetical protein
LPGELHHRLDSDATEQRGFGGPQMLEKVRKLSGETPLKVHGKGVVLIGQAPI